MKLTCILLLAVPLAGVAADLDYTYPTARLGGGQSFGNQSSYVTLDRNTNIPTKSNSARFGLRESTDERYYLWGWSVQVANGSGVIAEPTGTMFHPESQETVLQVGEQNIRKEFFLPLEYGYTRTAHYVLKVPAGDGIFKVASTLYLPPGSKVTRRKLLEWNYAEVAFPDEGKAVIWCSAASPVFSISESRGKAEEAEAAELKVGFDWSVSDQHREAALSFAYTPGLTENADFLLDALFDRYAPGSPSTEAYLRRLHLAFKATSDTIERYLRSCRLVTPDPLINRATQWAKITQLRLQQEYRSGYAFTNNPPSDIVVGRDSMWYLMGSSYYAQEWSRKLLDFWFRNGLELSGKFTEYLAASREPLFQDDYGLNVNDNTPLLMIAAHHYYSLTGDRGFLSAVYPGLLRSANLILRQREVGSNNHYRLVWCDSTETFVRGLCGWRNAIRDYNLAGAVTELNVECYHALLMTAELAREIGDDRNAQYLESAARDLFHAIQTHLRDSRPPDSLYYLNINPAGVAIKEHTADLLFPVLYGVADSKTSHKILADLFSPEYWVANDDGAGGFRTVSSKEAGFVAEATPASYGLLGGVWPNLALWIARAASLAGLPDLSRKALDASARLTEAKDPEKLNVVPGEFPEYFNGTDLKQRGMPLSSFVPGIYIWSATESFLGLAPHAAGLTVEPQLPSGWEWAGIFRLNYRGTPVSILALRDDRTVYTTIPLQTHWKQVVLTPELPDRYTFEPSGEAYGLVIPTRDGKEIIVISDDPQNVAVRDVSGRQIAMVSVPASGIVRQTIH